MWPLVREKVIKYILSVIMADVEILKLLYVIALWNLCIPDDGGTKDPTT